MVILSSLLGIYTVVMVMTFLLNLTLTKKMSDHPLISTPLVSILIPARNEEANLKKNLPHWLEQSYPKLEILILDDQSEDNTRKVIQEFPSPIKAIEGSPVPKGWLGKNWACHQLSIAAAGEILLFVDSDVTPGKNAVLRTVTTLQHFHLGALSAFLRQDLTHWASKAVIPWALQFPLLAWTPLFLNRFYPFKSLSLANGQWFAFTKAAYEQVGGHQSVKGSNIEDLALAKILFENKVSHQVFFNPKLATVTMYRNWAEVRDGFTKNLASILGGSILGNFFFFILFFGVASALVFKSGICLFFLCLVFVGVQIFFEQPLSNPFFYICGLFITPYLLIRSRRMGQQKQTFWKGRRLE